MVCDTNDNNNSNDFVVRDNPIAMAREIIEDYVKHRLRIAGHIYRNGPTENPTAAMRTMRYIAQQFEGSYINAEQVDMTRDIEVVGPNADREILQALDSIFSELFSSNINWGRIVGSVVLTSKLSLKACAQNQMHIVDNLVSRAASHLQSPRFSTWIDQHGGWVSIVMID